MDKWTKAVAKLNRLTQEGSLRWEQTDPPELRGTSDVVEIAYTTEFEGERLRIFSKRSKVALDEERYDWSESPVLQVVDARGRSRFEFPPSPGLYDLLDSVRYQTSGVGTLLDKLAGEG